MTLSVYIVTHNFVVLNATDEIEKNAVVQYDGHRAERWVYNHKIFNFYHWKIVHQKCSDVKAKKKLIMEEKATNKKTKLSIFSCLRNCKTSTGSSWKLTVQQAWGVKLRMTTIALPWINLPSIYLSTVANTKQYLVYTVGNMIWCCTPKCYKKLLSVIKKSVLMPCSILGNFILGILTMQLSSVDFLKRSTKCILGDLFKTMIFGSSQTSLWHQMTECLNSPAPKSSGHSTCRLFTSDIR